MKITHITNLPEKPLLQSTSQNNLISRISENPTKFKKENPKTKSITKYPFQKSTKQRKSYLKQLIYRKSTHH